MEKTIGGREGENASTEIIKEMVFFVATIFPVHAKMRRKVSDSGYNLRASLNGNRFPLPSLFLKLNVNVYSCRAIGLQCKIFPSTLYIFRAIFHRYYLYLPLAPLWISCSPAEIFYLFFCPKIRTWKKWCKTTLCLNKSFYFIYTFQFLQVHFFRKLRFKGSPSFFLNFKKKIFPFLGDKII